MPFSKCPAQIFEYVIFLFTFIHYSSSVCEGGMIKKVTISFPPCVPVLVRPSVVIVQVLLQRAVYMMIMLFTAGELL